MMDSGVAYFREEQRFRQWWLWVLLIGMAGLVLVLFGAGLYQQLVLGRPWGDHPMSDRALIATALATWAFVAAIIWMLYSAVLITEVRSDGLYVRFFPFHFRFLRFPFERIRSYEARTYSPIGEFGGWGIRYGCKSKAYNVDGDRGLQLEFADGRRLLIGSQRAGEFVRTLASFQKRMPAK
jgi:hypothetical protein